MVRLFESTYTPEAPVTAMLAARHNQEDIEMDPIVSSIVTALTAGALGSLKNVAGSAVTDAYKGLKKILVDTYHCESVSLLDKKPQSESFKGAVAEQIGDGKVTEDEAVLEKASEVMRAIEADRTVTEALKDAGIEIGDVRAHSNVLIETLKAARGVKIGNVVAAQGDATIKNIESGLRGN